MTKARILSAVSVALVVIGGVSCRNSNGDSNVAPGPLPSPQPQQSRYAAAETGRASVPIVVLDRDTRMLLGAVQGDGSPGTSGATLINNGHRMTVFRNADGLPWRTVADDVVFLFENYTATTVDIAAVAGGQHQIARRVPIDVAKAAALRSPRSFDFATPTSFRPLAVTRATLKGSPIC